MSSRIGSNRVLIASAGVAAIIIVVALAVAFAMGGGDGDGFEGTIAIGASLSLTGDFQMECIQALTGAMAAAMWVNDQGGVDVGGKRYKLEIRYFDDKGDPEEAVKRVEYLVRQEGVRLFLAPCASFIIDRIASLIEDSGALMVVYGDVHSSLFERGFKGVVQVSPPAREYFTKTLEMVRLLDPQAKTVAIVYYKHPYVEEAVESAIETARELGFDVALVEAYGEDLANIDSTMLRLQAVDPDVILGGGHYPDGVELVKKMADYGIDAKLVAILVAPSIPEFGDELGSLAEAIAYPTPWELSAKPYETPEGFEWYGPTANEFFEYFAKAAEGLGYQGLEPSYHAAMAATAVLILAKAISDADSLDPIKVREAINGHRFTMFSGNFSIDPETGAQTAKEVFVGQWVRGKKVIVWPPGSAYATPIYPHPGWG